jgi:hypothetical protein
VNDHAFFDKVHACADDPKCIRSLFDHLMARDLSGFSRASRPETQCYRNAKAENSSNLNQFLIEVASGEIAFQGHADSKLIHVRKSDFYTAYSEFCERHGVLLAQDGVRGWHRYQSVAGIGWSR